MPDVRALERTEHVGVPQTIAIGLASCAIPRVEGVRDEIGLQHADAVGKAGIQRSHEAWSVDRTPEGEAGDLAERVDARVSTSSAGHNDFAVIEPCQRLLQQTLNRHARGLPLPSNEGGAVVGQRDLECHRGAGREPGFTIGTPCAHKGQLSDW